MKLNKRWHKLEVDFLKNNYRFGIDYCAEKLNRTRQSIISKKIILKLINIKKDKWNIEEEQFLKENYTNRGTRYCSQILNRSKSSVGHKIIKLKLKRTYNRWTKENLEKVVRDSYNYSEACLKIGLKGCGNRKQLKKYINLYNIDISHFKRTGYTKNLIEYAKRRAIPLHEILVQNSKYTSSNSLKKKLYGSGLKKRNCEQCGQGEIWRDKKMSLILDHDNGVNNDNRIENLKILCPNCNATTDTFCRGYKKLNKVKPNNIDTCVCGSDKYKRAYMCRQCYDKKPKRKVERPMYEVLLKQINETNYCAVGRLYGVSDNCIRKWINDYKQK